MLGVIQIDLIELMQNKGRPQHRTSPFMSPSDPSKRKGGSLTYTVGYYGKLTPNSALRTSGTDPAIPSDDILRVELAQDERRATALNSLEQAVLCTPPDPEWPAGVVSVMVHEVKDLVARRTSRAGEEEDEQEEGEGLPSAYCTM
jgi:Ca2+-dependent lipid-binding protein